ncbi:MAG TPA: FecR family protein, partial [Pyrinomonadaceae bacterium]|nr:FecR family protein [Pyrinomonadaceae bacterium]
MKKRELDNLLDEVTAGIRSEQIDDAAIKGASDRVWSRMNGTSTMLADSVQEAGPSNRIEGCADFQSLIPAYLGSQLTEARSLLLVDHTHECIPCRKALKNARESRVAVKADRIVKMQTRKRAAVPGYSLRPVVLRWGIAAVLVIGLGLIALPIVERYVPVGSLDATVQAAEGPLYGVADAKTRALNVGEKIGQGDVLRTPKDGRAMVRLQDGTTIEMKDRSEVSLKRTMNGTTLHVDGGSVIVQATKQQQPRRTVFGKLLRTLHLVPQDWGSFYVQTGDSIVAVAGTTFAVNAGTKGSRVSVIEGEVHLDHNGQDKVLRSGEQATTNVAIEAVPVKEDVKWSRNAAQYAQVLDALASLKNELRAVPKPGVRNSTRLLEMMPATTVMYAAIPNLAASITESNRIIEERIQQNPALRDWFANRREPRGPAMNQAIAAIKDFGDQLGEEIAVGAGMSDQGQPTEPIVLAQLKNPGGFRAFFDAEVQKLNTNGKAPQVIWIDDPKTAQPAATTGQGPLYVWITGDVLVGSPKLAQLQAVANGASGFSATPFYSRIAQVYSEGAGIVVAADLEKIIAHTRGVRRIGMGDDHEQALNQLGIFNVTSFVLDSKDTDG